MPHIGPGISSIHTMAVPHELRAVLEKTGGVKIDGESWNLIRFGINSTVLWHETSKVSKPSSTVRQELLSARARCAQLLSPAPFEVAASAWCVRARA